MRLRNLLFCLLAASSAFAYTYDFSGHPFYQPNWIQNGLSTTFAAPESEIYVATVSGANSNDYEVLTDQDLTSGGTFIHFVRASTNALASSGSCAGSYFSAELVVTAASPYPSAGSLYIRQCVSGSLSTLATTSVSIAGAGYGYGSRMRTVVFGTNLWVYVGGTLIIRQTISATTGHPGAGGYNQANGMQPAMSTWCIGPHDTYAPNPVAPPGLRSSVFPASVSLAWQGAADDTNSGGGIGVYGYQIVRDGTNLGMVFGSASFGDQTVSPSTTYNYTISAMDYHGNLSSGTAYSITTPPTTTVDPRRVGLYNTGSYWGGGGEQIDTLSGNLHYSIPIVKAMSRTGWQVPVNLVYNSQNWRQDGSTNWELGEDIGYGYGWKMLIGSLTPYYKGWPNGVNHYIYTDATGAEYRLDQNSGGIWSSQQGLNLWFDTNTNLLHFKDGTFWLMGSVSSGAEQDAGTLYPTIIEDTSGNRVVVTYSQAPSLNTVVSFAPANTSGRIAYIQDTRSRSPYFNSYWFSYNPDYSSHNITDKPHWIGFGNYIGTAESGAPTLTSAALAPPFGADTSYSGITTFQLTGLAIVGVGTYSMTYDSAGASELMQVTFPWGGHLRWSYTTANYAGGRALREVSNRYLAAGSTGATEWTYPFTHSDSSSTIATVHTDTTLADASGIGAKKWQFTTSGSAWQIGLISVFQQKASASGTVITDDTYTWSQSSSSAPYISQKISVKDPGTGYAQSTKTTQSIDGFGNLTQVNLYPYNNTTTPVETYDSTYLGTTTYVNNYIRDRLLSTAVTTSAGTKTLITNYYDGANSSLCTYDGPSTYTGGSPNIAYNAYPPILASGQGLQTASVTAAKTACAWREPYGRIRYLNGTDGQKASLVSGGNSMSPSTVTTQSYSYDMTYNTWQGVTSTTGANGETTSMAYDSLGRPYSGTSAYGITTNYVYPTSSLPRYQETTGPGGYMKTTLDGLGRAIRVERGPDSSTIQAIVDTVYSPCACSPMGKVQKTSMPYAPGTSAGSIKWAVYTYDGIGRPVSVVSPDAASTTSYLYTGNQTKTTDPAGHWKRFTNDALGNLVTVEEPDPANPTTNTFVTSYSYDWAHHLACADMTRGGTSTAAYTYTSGGVSCTTTYTGGTRQTRLFVYNDAGQLTSTTNPESGTVSYTYNADGTLQKKHDAKGQDVVYTYDSQKRPSTTKYYPSGTGGAEDLCQRVSNVYGTNTSSWNYNRLIETDWNSDSSCVTNYAYVYSYNPQGGVTSKTMNVTRPAAFGTGTNSVTVSYAYNSAGQVSQTTYPFQGEASPITFTYGFDSMGRPSSLVDNRTSHVQTGYINWVQNAQYDLAGRMSYLYRYQSASDPAVCGVASDNLLYEGMSYNVNGQLATKASAIYNLWCGTSFSGSLTYSYASSANNGQITQVADTMSGETVVYGYDALSRLVSAASTPISGGSPAAWTQTYQYDGFSNLTARVLNGTTSTIAVDASTNRLTSSYDANGNMLSGAGLTLTYDENNRVVSASPTSGGAEYYGYDPGNKRIYQYAYWGSGAAEQFTFYGAFGEKLGQFSFVSWTCPCTPPFNASNVWFAGKKIWDGLYNYRSSSWPTGNLAPMEDRTGNNRSDGARYYPYGEQIGGFSATANDHEKFGTYNRDSFTGLDYADQRYYASNYGRFNTPDPFSGSAGPGNPLSWNRYSYALGDPVNGNDPNGLCVQDMNGNWWDSSQLGGGSYIKSLGDLDCRYYSLGEGAGGSVSVNDTYNSVPYDGDVPWWVSDYTNNNFQIDCPVCVEVGQNMGGFDEGMAYFGGGSAGLGAIGAIAPMAGGYIVGRFGAFMAGRAGAVAAAGAAGAASPGGRQIIVNIGGELEGPANAFILQTGQIGGGVNLAVQNGLRVAGATGQPVVLGLGNSLPFADGSVNQVIINNVPIGTGSGYFGPYIDPAEITRILAPGGSVTGSSAASYFGAILHR